MKKIILVLLLLTFKLSEAQTGWFWQNPVPQGQSLRDIQIRNGSTIYTSGENGVFMKSTNGGSNWSVQNIIPVSVTDYSMIYKLNFITDNIIFALGSTTNRNTLANKNKLYKSFDGGNNWTSLPIDNNSSFFYTDMKFVNANTGFCFDVFNSEGKIIKTTNAGITWERLSILGNDSLSYINFPNENTGYVTSFGLNDYKTTNAGVNWITTLDSNMYSIDKLYFINGSTGYCNAYTGFYKTTNGGANWLQTGYPVNNLRKFAFINETTGWANINRNLYITTNSGTNWILSLNSNNIGEAYFSGTDTGFATGDWGRIYKTTNRGNNWQDLRQSCSNDYQFVDIFFTGENTGFVCGPSGLFRSTNGGSSWNLIDTLVNYNSVKFINQNTGFALGFDEATSASAICRTTNAGLTWVKNLYPNLSLYSLTIINPELIKIPGMTRVNSINIVYQSTDYGQTWLQYNRTDNFGWYWDFVNETTGWSYGAPSHYLYKTTNTGNNWITLSARFTELDPIFDFTDENTGWNPIDSIIYKTTNGGVNWVENFRQGTLNFRKIKFINSNTGWCIGNLLNSTVILKTTNSGANWTINNNFGFLSLSNIFPLNANILWCTGIFGTIIKTTTGGTIGIQQISTSLPDKFYLQQNYPNPFNPNTNIEFSLHQKSFVKLKIFDLLGREVANLVNEILSAGSYKYDFNASLLPSGIYFYKLETENFSEVRKMILVK